MERGGHGSFRLARGEISVGDFLAGLIEPGLYVVSQFKLIFEVIINPRANPLDLSAGEPGQNRLNLLNSAHGGQSNEVRVDWKAVREPAKAERDPPPFVFGNSERKRSIVLAHFVATAGFVAVPKFPLPPSRAGQRGGPFQSVNGAQFYVSTTAVREPGRYFISQFGAFALTQSARIETVAAMQYEQ